MDRYAIARSFVNDVHAHLGSPTIGAVLFGSVSSRTDRAGSDIDILIAACDEQIDDVRRSVKTARRRVACDVQIAVSTETYSRLAHFIDAGDPFVRTVCGTGEILEDADGRLAELRARCAGDVTLPDRVAAAQYLRAKALVHHRRVVEHLTALRADLQLSLMARAQAICVQRWEHWLPETFFELSSWARMEAALADVLDVALAREARVMIEDHKNGLDSRVFSEFQETFTRVARVLEEEFDRLAAIGPASEA